MTNAILMAAGRGTRISRTINDYCKCTLDIGGIPLIRHTVEMFIANNVNVHIVVGYDKQRIFNALQGLSVTYYENVFYSITNSLSSLWFAREAIKGDMVILGNADVYWEFELLKYLFDNQNDNRMLCDSSRVEQGDYLFRTEQGRLLNFGKGNDCYGANCEYVGLASINGAMVPKFHERLAFMVQQQHHSDWWEQVLYSMVVEHPIWTTDIAGNFWAEIDYIEDYNRILEYRKGLNR